MDILPKPLYLRCFSYFIRNSIFVFSVTPSLHYLKIPRLPGLVEPGSEQAICVKLLEFHRPKLFLKFSPFVNDILRCITIVFRGQTLISDLIFWYFSLISLLLINNQGLIPVSLPASTFYVAALNVIGADYVQVKGLTRKQTGLNEFLNALAESVVEFGIFESIYANMDNNPC